jgi:hypothetical protein
MLAVVAAENMPQAGQPELAVQAAVEMARDRLLEGTGLPTLAVAVAALAKEQLTAETVARVLSSSVIPAHSEEVVAQS